MFSIQSHPDKRAAVKAIMFRDHVKGNRVVVLVNDQWSSGKLGREEMHLAISIQVSS